MRKVIIILIFCFDLFFAHSTFATKLCILRGFDFSIYDEVVSAFKNEVQNWEMTCDLILKNNQNAVTNAISKNAPDVVLALGNSAVTFMEQNFPRVLVVYGMAQNVQAKNNQSGINVNISFDKQLEMVKQAFGSLRRIGVIYSAKNLNQAQQFMDAAKRHGIQVNSHAVSSPQEVVNVVPKLRNEDLFWILLDDGVLTVNNRDEILELAYKLELKTYAFSPVYLKGPYGADLSVSISWTSYGQQMAKLAKKMVENPQKTYPIEEPFDVKIYLKKGRAGLNYNVANAVLVQ